MSGSRALMSVLAATALLAAVACGSSPEGALVGPSLSEDQEDALVTEAGRGPGAPPANPPAPGDGVCDDSCLGDGVCDGTGPGRGPGPSGDAAVSCCDPEDLRAVLEEALQLEYLAQVTYESVLLDLGDLAPFSNIAPSEATHVEALRSLFERRAWEAPASVWNAGNVGHSATFEAACAAGVQIEIDDVALYDGYLARTDLPKDAVNVFQNLRLASLEHHLPAFLACP